MKIAAVLVPIAILSLPTMIQVIIVLRYGLKGKDIFKNNHPMTDSKRKKLMVFVYVYMFTFVASISWAIYVFTDNIWITIAIPCGFILIFIIAKYGHLSSNLPKPPPGGFTDDKGRLDFENKCADIESENLLKGMKLYLKIGIPLIFLIVIIIAIVAACLAN